MKNKILRFKNRFYKYLQRYATDKININENKIGNNEDTAKKKYLFEKLTPIDNADLYVYEDALNFVFDNSDVRNVAVSGAYSAGKSSVLASYKKKHREIHFLHISLAHFQFNEQKEDADTKAIMLEGKILNQLIHQIPAENIPQTNFKVKKGIKPRSVIKSTILVCLFLISSLHLTFFDQWKEFISYLTDERIKSIFLYSIKTNSLIISGIIIWVISGIFIYKLIEVQKNRKIFRKLKIQGNEIEILEEAEDSYFDKYLNEVLYLFENSLADAIVFEDMDRFNTGLIFEHLREINTLVNIQKEKDGGKVLRFIYLLRDDIFVSKDRTKFFDCIIPVVPVVDSSNSFNKFIEHFEQSGILDIFDSTFSQGLSLYIDDMRLLKNMHNEFLKYYNRLNITELNPNKMLGMIAYKNLFPRDFSELQLNRGFVYTIFFNKDDYIQDEIEGIRKEINEKNERISRAKQEHLLSIRELNVSFADKYLSSYSWYNYDNNRLNEFLESHLSTTSKEHYRIRTQSLQDNISLLEEEIEILEYELIKIKNKKLSQFITRENKDNIFSVKSSNGLGQETEFSGIKGSEYFDLLKYLICYGYIDESYSDYIAYFYEDSLSRIDKIFLRSITDQKAKEYTFHLKNPGMVASRLRLVDFEQGEVLNFELLDYLQQTPIYREHLNCFIRQLQLKSNFKFIGEYFEWSNIKSVYVKNLNSLWPEFFCTILKKNALTNKQIRLYSIFTLYYSDTDIIKVVNTEECLQRYISLAEDFLSIEEPDIEKLVNGFLLLGVRFTKIDYEVANKQLLSEIIRNELYEINSDNLKMILEKVYGVDQIENILHKNYTAILSLNDSVIADYMHKNMEKYINVVLAISEGYIEDDEEIALKILNSGDVLVEQKELYLSKLNTIISRISGVSDKKLWREVLDNRKVLFTEINIMDFFCEVKKLDSCLVKFINDGEEILDFSKIKSQYTSEQVEEFFDAVVICNTLEDNKYCECLASLNLCYDYFTVPNLPKEKFKILLDKNIIKMTVNSLLFIRENYPNDVLYYISRHIEKYVQIIDNTNFSFEELIVILEWEILDEFKIQLIGFTQYEISILKTNLSTEVCVYILMHNLMKTDLPVVFENYDKYEVDMQKSIFSLAVEYIATVVDNSRNISKELKYSLLASGDLSMEVKNELLIMMIPDLKEAELKEIFQLLNLSEYLKIFDSRTRPRFSINNMNEQRLIALKENNWIRDYEEDANKLGYYKIIKRVATKELSQVLY